MKTINHSHITITRAFLVSMELLMSYNCFAGPELSKSPFQTELDALQDTLDTITYEIGETGPR